MEVFIFYLLTGLILFGDQANDPIQSAWLGRTNARQFECERMSQAQAHNRYPGSVAAPNARAGALMQIDALACHHRVAADGQRDPREETILARLDDEVSEMTGLALPVAGDDARWFVDAFYPDETMVQKIAGASRVALVQQGQRVMDTAPLLSAGDLIVLHSLPMKDAIPAACKRLFDSKKLVPGDAFLTVALLHREESQLHAGVCVDSGFRWLR